MEGERERERERLTNTGLNVFLILHVWSGRCDFLMCVYKVFELLQCITIAKKKSWIYGSRCSVWRHNNRHHRAAGKLDGFYFGTPETTIWDH